MGEHDVDPFRATVENFPDSVSIFRSVRDGDGKLVDFEWVYSNPAHRAATDHTSDDLVGRRLSEVFPVLSESGLLERYRRVVETGEPYRDDSVWFEGTGGDDRRERRAFDIRAAKVGDGLVIVSRNVSAERIAMLEANEALQQADEVKTTFLRTVSHDVRSPLTAILSAARLLEGDIPLSDEERTSFVQMIIRNSNRIRDLLDDVLDVERVRAGDPIEPEPELVDVATLVAEIEPELLNATGKTITVHADVPTVWADHTMLERIMHNLLGNAVKYTAKSGEIAVRTWQQDDTTILAVDDQGIGVPDDAKEVIFEPFRRAADVNVPGSGIGLSLVSAFARAHGGRAWVEDNPGGGSSFRVCFPTASA